VHPNVALVCALLANPGGAAARVPQPPPPPAAVGQRTLRVTGEGEVSVRPDVAVVTAGVEAEGKDLAAVTAEVNAQMRKVLAALGQVGVAEKDVLTTRHDVQVNRPWRDGVQGPISGYTVVQEVRVTVRDLSRLGAVLDRVVAAGANALRGLSFEKETPVPERAAALASAVRAARVKAEAVAKAAGVQLGEVLTISESVTAQPFPNVRTAMAQDAGGAAPSAGDIRISAAVEVVFGIR
jgi:uncharacterized protein YggE